MATFLVGLEGRERISEEQRPKVRTFRSIINSLKQYLFCHKCIFKFLVRFHFKILEDILFLGKDYRLFD